MGNEHILVVEDGEPIRNLLKARLEKDGYRVSSVGQVPDALQIVRTAMPDVVILDLTLDKEDPFATLTDGFSFLGMLRHQHPHADPVVVIYTANDSPPVHARAKSMQVHSVIGKKAGVRPLLEAIAAGLAERKSENAVPSGVQSPDPQN